MKKSEILKLILIILICVLIILVGFFGIYSKKTNAYKNNLPEYKLASDLEGSVMLEFEVDDGSEKVYYDKDGNEVDSSIVTEENKNEYTEKEEPINKDENLTSDNYKQVMKIMKERLKFLQTDQYKLDLDEKTGKIVLTFEDEYPDDIKSILPMEGKFELVDSNTNDVIISHTDFNSIEATYASVEEGYTTYINIKLNSSGIERINNIDKYKTTTDTESGDTTTNKLKIMFDNDEVAEISYDNILLTGKTLRVTTAEKLTSNSSINSEMSTNTVVSKLASIGKMPVVYKLTAEEYVKSNVATYAKYVVIAIAIICVIISLYFIIRYKLNGLLTVIAFATNISLFLILIRLTKIQISLNGFAGILVLIMLNTILVNNILKSITNKDKTFSENIKNAYLKTMDVFVIVLIIFAVFAFSAMTVISEAGLLMFWGWVVILLGNLILTVPMLCVANNK